MATYPAHREVDVALRDGSTIRVRPVREADRAAMRSFFDGLTPESQYFRFFSGTKNFEPAVEWATKVDYVNRYGLVATTGPDEQVVAHAAWQRADAGSESAEVAFVNADEYQGRGLGTILLAHLAEAAEDNGVSLFEAEVLPENHRMIEVFRQSGFQVHMALEPGVIKVRFPTSLSTAAIERFEHREQTSAIAAMRNFFNPRSVAVIGASRSTGTIGSAVFRNLIAKGFHGPVYPVNPKADVVHSVAAYPSVLDVPGPVDLAVIVVPARLVIEVARGCGEKGVKALVIISAGFAETGEEGIARQRELMDVCRNTGMRLIGPNCMGIMNTDPNVMLDASFAPLFPPRGRVGFSSQSGALGLAVIDYARQLGLGMSTFVSVGNKADISGNDLINYWAMDPDTDLILLYLESFGNPRKFSRICRRVAKTKPIVAVKSGRSSAGARATSSHTGALIAASDATVDALFTQAGVIRTDTLNELFDVASLLANQPPPRGRRVAIVTNAGGPGILCADACEAAGLTVGPLPDDVRTKLEEFLPAEASTLNPVDMIASASAGDYKRAIQTVAASEDIDALIVIFIPPLVTRPEDVADAISEATAHLAREVPLLTVFMSSRGVPDELSRHGVRIPSYAFPEDAARALARATDYGIWRRRPDGSVPDFEGCRRDEGAAIIAEALGDEPVWLSPEQTARLFDCYGLPLVEQRLAGSAEEAARVAGEMGRSVALKAVAPGLVHKTEAGGVRLGLIGRDEVGAAAVAMQESVRAAGHEVDEFLVQPMVDDGVEMIVGVAHDPSFGPVVACGAGGTAVELLKDVGVRITPLTDDDASAMVRALATYPLLEGYRGSPPTDIRGLEDLLLRVSTMVEAHPEVLEMDCNPVKVAPRAVSIVDARVRVAPVEPALPLSARRKP
ncbi:MAG: GNAT family N-acetyltransferase [Actinomycetota bacterium]|nr:GNAT family N-acetyltransferase [Actinomycetota bacterium]